MVQIADYSCPYDNSVGIREAVTRKLELTFPDAYKNWKTMRDIALALKKEDKAEFCELPFCHTVEGEAMGGIINYGDAKSGPRAKTYICQTPEEILALPQIDFTKGRIREVLKACEALSKMGETVVFEISGPFTVLNVLADASITLKWMRKQPEEMKAILEKLKGELLRYMQEAARAGAAIISYADSTGGVNILGPKQMAAVTELFTYPLLKEADKILPENVLIQLCPKTSFALIGTDLAKWKEIKVSDGELSYGQACGKLVGRARFTGQTCIKNIEYCIDSTVQTLELTAND